MSDTPKRPRGRPRTDKAFERISTRLPTEHYDRLTRMARQHDIPLAKLTRQLLILQIPRED
jgi:hypothetical protein